MYRKKDKSKQMQLQMLCIEDLVPQDHMLRDIENAIDWSFIYDEVKGLYKEAEWGNPGIDPVVLFKIVFIQYLYGIRSMRQTIKEIEVNIAYRWFIGYDLTEPIPHFSTFGKNYKRRFEGTDIFERIFGRILEEAVKCGFVDASAIFIDGTHIRANANKKKYVKEVVAVEAKRYQKELDEEINNDREAHGKKPLKDKKDDNDDENNSSGGAVGGAGLCHLGKVLLTAGLVLPDPAIIRIETDESTRKARYVGIGSDINRHIAALRILTFSLHELESHGGHAIKRVALVDRHR